MSAVSLVTVVHVCVPSRALELKGGKNCLFRNTQSCLQKITFWKDYRRAGVKALTTKE